MFIQLTRTDGSPIWLNSSFIVTIEPARGGGSIVVPIGDGLDYDVRESPDKVLAMLDGEPSVKVVPVPSPNSLTERPDDVSPEIQVAEEKAAKSAKKTTKAAKTKSAPKKKTAGTADDSAKTAAAKQTAKRKSAATKKKASEKPSIPEDFTKIAEDLKSRKCRTVKRIKNAIKSFHGKSDSEEIDRIIEAMMNTGLIVVEADGHVNWLAQVT